MNYYKTGLDIALNMVAPILLGMACYGLAGSRWMPAFISNHFADGLWAYAFLSTLLIIWKREINLPWVVAAFCVAAGLEYLQYRQIIEGTGDLYDVLTYSIFFIIALKFNRTFKKKFDYQNQNLKQSNAKS